VYIITKKEVIMEDIFKKGFEKFASMGSQIVSLGKGGSRGSRGVVESLKRTGKKAVKQHIGGLNRMGRGFSKLVESGIESLAPKSSIGMAKGRGGTFDTFRNVGKSEIKSGLKKVAPGAIAGAGTVGTGAYLAKKEK